ncbi:hypothetical protein [Phytohabitans kaempferiae]|uniref:Uncharacterized protein n=1 Tax=Phytohabitans kaempferiae TaxID=1620943 RepID=A0ABV6M457_9ACTN
MQDGYYGQPASADHDAESASAVVRNQRARAIRELTAAVAIALACIAWLAVGGLVLFLVGARDEPEGMTGFAVAVVMPFVLVPALGLTSVAAQLGRTRWRGWIAPTIAIVAGLAALVVLVGWWSLVDLLS